MDNLIDRYIAEVGKNLPGTMRSDIEAELRSTIQDNLDDRSKSAGRSVDEDMIVTVLKEFGSPEKVAASYLPEKYLIGPRLYPLFTLVLRIVVAVLVVLALVRLGVDVGRSGATAEIITNSVLKNLGQMATTLLQALGNVVLVFAILQWVMPDLKLKQKDWDPRSLKSIPDTERVDPAGQIGRIGIILAGLLVFNFYPQILGMANYVNGQWTFFPLLTPVFFGFLPWLNLVWLLNILLSVILLRQRTWQLSTRWLQIGVTLINIVILAMMLNTAGLVGIDPQSISTWGLSGMTANQFVLLVNSAFSLAIGLVMVMEIIGVAKRFYRLLGQKVIPVVSPKG